MTKDDFKKSATNKGKTDKSSHQGQGASVVKFQAKPSHILAPRPPMPKSLFGHIMPVAMNLKVLPTLVTASKDETEKESKQDEE